MKFVVDKSGVRSSIVNWYLWQCVDRGSGCMYVSGKAANEHGKVASQVELCIKC